MFEMCLFPKADEKVSGKWEVSPRRTDDQRKETMEMKYLVIGLVLIFIALYLVMLYSLLNTVIVIVRNVKKVDKCDNL